MREKFSTDEASKGSKAVNRLRMRCSFYKDFYNQEDKDPEKTDD